jgi:hypothetical protein
MKTSLIPFLMLFSIATYAQTDSIYKHNEILTGKIKSIGATHLVYVPSEMTVELTLNLLTVKKVHFENGNEMEFDIQPQNTQIKNSAYQKPEIHFNSDELLGYRANFIDFFASRALFLFVPLNRIKKRLYRKIENRAIIKSCNHVLINSEKAVNWQPFTFKSTNATAQFYNLKKPKIMDTTKIAELIQKKVSHSIELSLAPSSNKLKIDYSRLSLVQNVHLMNNEIYVVLVSYNTLSESTTVKAKVATFNSNSITLTYDDEVHSYRYDIYFE